MYKNVYFLHIPKTAGRYLYHNILWVIQDTLVENNIRIDVHHDTRLLAHQQWCESFIDDSTYIVCSLREPAEQLVSYYCHLYGLKADGTRRVPVGGDPINRESFFTWLNSVKDAYSNYQVKNILHTNLQTGLTDPLKAFAEMEIDEALLEERLSRINLLVRSSDLTEENTLKLREKLLSDLGITSESASTITGLRKNPGWQNDDSSTLYGLLNAADIKLLNKISSIDKKIYDNDSLFWHP